jgi:hypothetical protein
MREYSNKTVARQGPSPPAPAIARRRSGGGQAPCRADGRRSAAGGGGRRDAALSMRVGTRCRARRRRSAEDERAVEFTYD